MVKKKFQTIFGLLLNTIYVYLIQSLNLSPNLTFPGLNIGTEQTSLTQEGEGTSVSALAQLSIMVVCELNNSCYFYTNLNRYIMQTKNRDLTGMNRNSCTRSTFLAAPGTWDY
jgi:hypothetical protein